MHGMSTPFAVTNTRTTIAVSRLPLPFRYECLGPPQAHLPRTAALPRRRHLLFWTRDHPRGRDLLQNQRRRPDAPLLHEHREPLGPLDVHREQRRAQCRPEEQRLCVVPVLHRRQDHRSCGDHGQQDPGFGGQRRPPFALATLFRPKQRRLPHRAEPVQERLRQQGHF